MNSCSVSSCCTWCRFSLCLRRHIVLKSGVRRRRASHWRVSTCDSVNGRTNLRAKIPKMRNTLPLKLFKVQCVKKKKTTLTPPPEFSHLPVCWSTSAKSQPVPGSIQAAEHRRVSAEWMPLRVSTSLICRRRSARMRNEMLFMGQVDCLSSVARAATSALWVVELVVVGRDLLLQRRVLNHHARSSICNSYCPQFVITFHLLLMYFLHNRKNMLYHIYINV